jgi:hypothetical protein
VRRTVQCAGALAIAGLLTVALIRSPNDGSNAVAAGASQPPTAGDAFAPELGLPAADVVAIGSSPWESSGEAWAYGLIGAAPASVAGRSYSDQYALLRYTDSSGWGVVPLPPGADGKPLAGSRGSTPARYGAFAGQATAAGGVVLLSGQSVVVRDPGAQPRLAPVPPTIEAEPPPGGVLAHGESLLPTNEEFSSGVTLPYAAIEDTAGASTPHTGVLIAPFDDGGTVTPAGEPGTQPGVLHYDGQRWSREPIEPPSLGEKRFTALALACSGTSAAPASSSPQDCWLLASVQVGGSTALLLFRRTPSGDPSGYTWESPPLGQWPFGAQLPSGMSKPAPASALPQGAQMLTATAQGVWVDFQATINPPAIGGAQEPSAVSEFVADSSSPQVLGQPWCYPVGPGCEQSLGAPLPAQYRSFAWPGASGETGTRIITGLPHRAMLELTGGSFSYMIGAGGDTGSAPGGAAFDPRPAQPQRGWIADGAGSAALDGAGQAQAIAVTPQPPANGLGGESVPFRRPLYAVAQIPGTTPGDPRAQAVAVGEDGQIGRYAPGVGWRPESLYDSAGKVQTPTLRGVAWPEPGRAYAVGDNGAMWLWRADTGLWEPDPATPLNFIGNLTAIVFSPSNPQLGYAVGKQGVLLRYGKSWEQVPLPEDLRQVNFTSVTLAGDQALATYRMVAPDPERPGVVVETGGMAIEDGSGWHVDAGAAALLAQLPLTDRVLAKVAGLPDGGAIAAGPGKAIERDSPSAGWRFSSQPLPEAQSISALAAYRDPAGPVRAIVSIDLDEKLNPEHFNGNLRESPFKGDVPAPTGPGQPPPFLAPDPLPNSGYLLRETANGWSDVEHEALPASKDQLPADMPIRPDPVLALLVDPSGASGLAVGGQTGDFEGNGVGPGHERSRHYQTAAALRFPAGAASPDGTVPVPIAAPSGQASFVVGGQAACAQECSDFAGEDIGPDMWLTHALQSASQIAASSQGGLRAFLYTGGRLPGRGSGEPFARELSRYESLLGGSQVPVYATDSRDLGAVAPGGSAAHYSFLSTGPSGGPVVVIVLDYSSGELGSTQREWLREQLAAARAQGAPAIVMGNAALGFNLAHQSTSGNALVVEAADASAVSRILIEGGASAYFFDYPGSNVKTLIGNGVRGIPAYGSGTLGYVAPPEVSQADSLGSSGIMLASVNAGARNPVTNVAPVIAEVVPNIGALALDATDGVLLRRSQVALFEALARRPPGGVAVSSGFGGSIEPDGPDPYDPIPFNCQGPNCAYEVPTQYTFTSSNPDIANFVAHESTSNNPRQVELGANQLPVPDAHSGLLCAYNEGTTIVSIMTGGLTYSEPVTVRGGSVEYPCGTVPLKNPPRAVAPAEASFSSPGIAPSSSPPASPQIQATLPAPVSPAPVPASPAVAQPLSPFLLLPPLVSAVPVIVPPLSPAVGRPTPPSGTAQVFEPSGVTQREEEDESAEETAGANQFSAYHPDEHPWPGPWLALALLVIVAGAGLAVGRSGPGHSSRRRDRHALARAGARVPHRPGRRG